MPRSQVIDPGRRLAVIALARIVGAAKAAKTGAVDVRTVRRWLEEEADADHDEQEWTAARQAAQERHLTGLLTGDPKAIAGWATAAGISARNQRYARLIARREEARQAKAEAEAEEERQQYTLYNDPAGAEWQTIYYGLDSDRSDLWHWAIKEILDRLDERDEGGKQVERDPSEGPGLHEWLLTFTTEIRDMPEDLARNRYHELQPDDWGRGDYLVRRRLVTVRSWSRDGKEGPLEQQVQYDVYKNGHLSMSNWTVLPWYLDGAPIIDETGRDGQPVSQQLPGSDEAPAVAVVPVSPPEPPRHPQADEEHLWQPLNRIPF